MLDFAIEYGLGVAIWLVALIVPFRRFSSRPEIAWDVSGAVSAHAFAVLAIMLLGTATDWAYAFTERWSQAIEAGPSWLAVLSYLVAADFGAYWAHRVLHTPWLWPTHAWHHSPKYLYWLSGLRGSPVHVIVLLTPYFVALMLFPLPEAAIVGGAFAVLDAGNQHLIHSNVKIPYVRQVERVLVTPRYHFVHHNSNIEIANSNYGFIFSVWDRLFGTYTDPDAVPVDADLGLSYEISNWRLLLGVPARR